MENIIKNPNAFAFANDFRVQEGMTLRDYFANSAMQGIMSNETFDVIIGDTEDGKKGLEKTTWLAYLIADAMLKQREL